MVFFIFIFPQLIVLIHVVICFLKTNKTHKNEKKKDMVEFY